MEEFQRTGKTIFEAIDLTAQAFRDDKEETPVSEVQVAASNEASLKALEKAMRGVK